jgi:dTDP-4-amino-4,6-dideoxygalactose transaminase
MATATAEKLALLGGMAASPQPLQPPAFPPADEATARRLSEVYLSRNWSFNGPEEKAFSAEFARYHGAKHGIFMANGTVTLQCALGALGVGPGDEVIMPALTWPATAMSALYVGATPVFVDVEPTTLCLDPAAFEAAITPRTKAVIPVHIYGGTADLERIITIADKHNIAVVEDCAHAHGGKWNGRGLGSWGAVGSFSFQQSKTMASGEGGICLTNDDELAERIFRMKHIGYNHGTAQGKASVGPPPGLQCHNFRGTDFQAVILRSQLEQLEDRIATYNSNATILEERLNALTGVRTQARGRLAEPQSYYAFTVLLEDGPLAKLPLGAVQAALAAEGFSTGSTYGPVYRHVLFNAAPESYRIANGSCPVSEGLGTKQALNFLHYWLGSDQSVIHSICDIFEKVSAQAETLADWTPPTA